MDEPPRQFMCVEHSQPYKSFCNTCARPVCSECFPRCSTHELVSLTAISSQAPVYSSYISLVERFPMLVQNYRRRLDSRLVVIQDSIGHTKDIISYLSQSNVDTKTIRVADVKTLEEAKRILKISLMTVITQAAQEMIRQAIGYLVDTNTIDDELSTVSNAIKVQEERLVTQQSQLITLKIKKQMVDILERCDEYFDGHPALGMAIHTLYQDLLAHIPEGDDRTDGDFEVFCGAKHLWYVQALLHLNYVKDGIITISKPIPLKISASSQCSLNVTISSNGVLAFTNRNLVGLDSPVLRLINLLNGRECIIMDIGEPTGLAFFNHSLYVFGCGKTGLLVGNICDIFKFRSVGAFEEVPIDLIPTYCEVSNAQKGTILVIAENKLYSLGLKYMSFTLLLEETDKLVCIVNTNIKMPNTQCLFTKEITHEYSTEIAHVAKRMPGLDADGNTLCNVTYVLCALSSDNTVIELYHSEYPVVAVILSSAHPSNINQALLFLSNHTVEYCGQYSCLENSLCHLDPYCIQRIYGDIYFIYESVLQQFYCVRISVP